MLSPNENPYNLRNKTGLKRKATFKAQYSPEKKRLRNFDHINFLPNEILLHIFSFLHIEDLYFRVRMVCKTWYAIAMMSSAWTNVEVSRYIPTHIVKKWIEWAPSIRRFTISNRNDADVILEYIAKYSPNLEVIIIDDCWGSTERTYLRSSALCKLLARCQYLGKIQLDKVRIRSCKFFKLLAKRKSRSKSLELSYIGPVSEKQLDVLKATCSGWVQMFQDDDE